ncbi:LysR family transcriptional regulator [Bacillus piscicola]|uniref:LysR family transcriptional regulator n=1 Tax=Bacillus piscicola TaxID=1632684 RepID=UPI001F088B81|nr:LysR family transcriptional regulator [Bacillus piscicola]
MDVKQLRYFQMVADQESFTRAASSLHVAQPAISRSIKLLEDELGMHLFIREKRRVHLTAAGHILKRHADIILAQVQKAKRELIEVREGIRGTVQIGIPSMAGSYYFPEKLAQFKRRHPAFSIELVEAGTTDIEEAILAGDLEMGTVVTRDHAELEIHPFLKEPLMMVVSRDHAFASRSTVTLQDLAQEPLILFKEGYYQRRVIEDAGELTGITPEIAFETNQISMAKSLTARGFGITVFLNMVVRPYEEELTAIPFEPPIELTLGIAHTKNTPLSHANAAFLRFLTT